MSPGVRWVSASLILNIFSSGSIETVFYALVWSSPLPMIHEFGVFMYSKDPCVLFYLLTYLCHVWVFKFLYCMFKPQYSVLLVIQFIDECFHGTLCLIYWNFLFHYLECSISFLTSHFCGVVTTSSSCSLGSTFLSLCPPLFLWMCLFFQIV